MEIRPVPAGLAQMVRGRDGQLIEVEDDVCGVARSLNEIDHHIRLRYSEAGGYWVVYWKPDEGEEGDGYLIFTAQDLDHRIVHKMRQIHWRCTQDNYSFAKELDEAEAKLKADQDYERDEEYGEIAERLAHAMREDLGYGKGSIFVKEGV